MLCIDCKHCKDRRAGMVSSRYYCEVSPGRGDKGRLGLMPWVSKQHPKCPLKAKDGASNGR